MSDWLERELGRELAPVAAPEALGTRLGFAPAKRWEVPRLALAVAAAGVLVIGGSYAARRTEAPDLRGGGRRGPPARAGGGGGGVLGPGRQLGRQPDGGARSAVGSRRGRAAGGRRRAPPTLRRRGRHAVTGERRQGHRPAGTLRIREVRACPGSGARGRLPFLPQSVGLGFSHSGIQCGAHPLVHG